MRRYFYRISLLIVALLFPALSHAITDEEIFRNFEFQFTNPGARAEAMGGAFIGLADDATAAAANPAGLTILTKPEVSFEYRSTMFDAQRLNSFNFLSDQNVDLTVGSFNSLDDLNQPAFLSVVFPADQTTYAFSRQEVSQLKGGVDEIFIAGFPEGELSFGTRGGSEQKIVNWNFSVATKLSNSFSLGATVSYSQLETWRANVLNTLLTDVSAIALYETNFDDSDGGFAWNAGMLWHVGEHASFGAVYKKNAKFEVAAMESGDFALDPGPYKNVLKVPDTLGFGLSVKPNDRITVTSDLVWIQYSDLTEGLVVGKNFLTSGLGPEDISYKIDDKWDFHIGAEFVVFVGSVPVALRQGYYWRSAHSLVVDSSPGVTDQGRNLLDAIFFERDGEHHFTLGNGFVFGPHFQIDWALDLANISDSFIMSTVVRF